MPPELRSALEGFVTSEKHVKKAQAEAMQAQRYLKHRQAQRTRATQLLQEALVPVFGAATDVFPQYFLHGEEILILKTDSAELRSLE